LAAVALAVVAAVYITTLITLPPSVFWSPDEGAKFLQMRGLLAPREGPQRVAYGAVTSDPFHVFYPDAFIYPRPLWPSGVRCHWPNLFPALTLPLFGVFGPWGLYALPLVGGLLSAALAACLARRLAPGAATPAALLTGLATPLFFHSMLYLEHSLACALALGALLFGWNAARVSGTRKGVRIAAAAFCAAGFVALRDEALLFFVALATAGIVTLTAGRRRLALLAGGALAGVLAAALAAGMAADAGANRWSELVANAGGVLAGVRDPAQWRALPRHALNVLVNNPEQFGAPLADEWSVTALLGFVLCALSPIVVARRRFACWAAGAALVATGCLFGLCLPDRYRAIHGLLLAMPGLAVTGLSVAASDDVRAGRGERLLTALLPILLALHVLVTWILRRPAGGPEWGLRYAMMAYVLAAVLGAVGLVRLVGTTRRWTRLAGLALAGLLLALSCGFQMRGVFELQVTKRDLRAFELEIEQAGGPIVTDQWWFAAALAPSFARMEIYTLKPDADLRTWINLHGRRSRQFLHVSYDPLPEAVTTGLGLMLTQRRTIQNMVFSQFVMRVER
jgi:hypothetical protein